MIYTEVNDVNEIFCLLKKKKTKQSTNCPIRETANQGITVKN